MIQFGSLEVEGFCSIQNLHINLNSSGITIIRGVNGEGKSNILSALVWVLYGKNLKGVSDINTWKKIRGKDYAGTIVTVYFQVDGVSYKVVRCQNYTHKIEGAVGGNRLLVYKDTILIPDKRKQEAQGIIEKGLGLSYQLFVNSIMFGQGLKRLIQESNSDKKNLFEEVFNLGYISDARDIAKEKMQFAEKQLYKQSELYKSTKYSLEATIESFKKATEDSKNFIESKRERISKLKSRRVKIESRISEIPPLEFDNKELSKIKERIDRVKTHQEDTKQKLNGLSLETVADNILKMLESKLYPEAIKELKSLKRLIGSTEIDSLELQSLMTKKYELTREYQKQTELKLTLKSLQEQRDGIIEDLRDVKSMKKPEVKAELKTKIDNLNDQILTIKSTLDTYQNEFELYKWVFTEPLGNNGIKAYLFESSLDELNNILRSYSESIGISIQFMIDTRTSRKDFETIIEMNGIMVLYEELSGGQKQLVNLAMAFAMNELVTKPRNLNLAFLDEVFESLSYDNIELVVSLIKKAFKNKTLFLITHQDNLPLDNSRTITVTKENGLSKYTF